MNNKELKKNTSIAHRLIFYMILLSILFIESLFTLFMISKKGFKRKEILSENNKFGFDFDIIIK